MAEKKVHLYEGDGEIIEPDEPPRRERPPALPGRRPLGRDEALREKDAYFREAEETRRTGSHYFASNEGLEDPNAPSGLFDDFDRYAEPIPRKRPPKRLKHKGLWMTLIVFCLLFLSAAGLLVIPQLTGMRYRMLPNLVTANGMILRPEEEKERVLAENCDAMFQDTIYPNIWIDDVNVGGLTREEAVAAVSAASMQPDQEYELTVSVGNQKWKINNERVPVRRNIEETVAKAWALGRSNTASLRGSGMTPFQERVRTASDIRSHPRSFRTERTYDQEALRTVAEGIANYVRRDPVDSMVEGFDFGTKTFTFTEDQPGAMLDAEALYAELCRRMEKEDYGTEVRAYPEKVLAHTTQAELRNSFGLISTYTTKTTSNKNRNTNIQLSAQAINGRTVLPGEIFSFNGATGERTAAKGYREAAAIAGGESRDEVGGGVCQTSSTLFNAVARANLEIIARSPHAWPSSYVEKGFDATVNWPGLDFKFRNNTDWPVFLTASYADRKVTVSVYGMSLGADLKIDLESETVRTLPMPQGVNYKINTDLKPGEQKRTVKGRAGSVVDTWQVWYQAGKEIKREKLCTSTYKAYQETIEYNPR